MKKKDAWGKTERKWRGGNREKKKKTKTFTKSSSRERGGGGRLVWGPLDALILK